MVKSWCVPIFRVNMIYHVFYLSGNSNITSGCSRGSLIGGGFLTCLLGIQFIISGRKQK